jgi:hypothetical protein
MAPPTGPRGGAPTGPRVTRSSTASRGGAGPSRGGIRKSGPGGPSRVDRDGDMVMGSGATANGVKKAPPANTRRGRGGGATRGGSRTAVASAEQKIRQHLGAHHTEIASRISDKSRRKFTKLHGKKVFRITGLGDSKAAANPDQGHKAILEFLERKTSKMGKGIMINRVSFRSPQIWLGIPKGHDYFRLIPSKCLDETASHTASKRSTLLVQGRPQSSAELT